MSSNPIPPAILYLTLGIASLLYMAAHGASEPTPGLCDMCESRARTVVNVLREGLVIFVDGYPYRTYEFVRKSPRCWGHDGEIWQQPLRPHDSVRKENESACWEMGWEYTVE